MWNTTVSMNTSNLNLKDSTLNLLEQLSTFKKTLQS